MSGIRIITIIAIFLLGGCGWFVLGSASLYRSMDLTSTLDHSVQALWGAPIIQSAPSARVNVPGSKRSRGLMLSASRVDAKLTVEQRRKGLIWYPTYVVDFSGRYTINNDTGVAQAVRIHFQLPSRDATYEALNFRLDDRIKDLSINTRDGIRDIINVAPGQTRTFTVLYRSRGLKEWRYRLSSEAGRMKNLSLNLTTNFKNVDFAEGTLSPMRSEETADGVKLTWFSADLVTRQDVGIVMPERINPGPLAARMSFFAPVCLLFFFVLITAICVIRKIDIHPMHYLFVNAGFFAFHLVFAYLVDLINLHLAFGVAAMTSVVLVVTYLRSALGEAFPVKMAALGQVFYLILFSYSFFIDGMTGITITVASVVTLAILMRMTAKLDWNTVFTRQRNAQPAL